MTPNPFDLNVIRASAILGLCLKAADAVWNLGAGALMLSFAAWFITRIVAQLARLYAGLRDISPRRAIAVTIVALALSAYFVSISALSALSVAKR